MVNSYTLTCSLIEIQNYKEKVIDIVRAGKCVGYSGTGDTVTFHFPTKGGAMGAFLELEEFLDTVTVSTSLSIINKIFLKGVFNYD